MPTDGGEFPDVGIKVESGALGVEEDEFSHLEPPSFGLVVDRGHLIPCRTEVSPNIDEDEFWLKIAGPSANAGVHVGSPRPGGPLPLPLPLPLFALAANKQPLQDLLRRPGLANEAPDAKRHREHFAQHCRLLRPGTQGQIG